MASGRLIDYLGSGDAGDRPAMPDTHPGTVSIWFSTDTQVLSAWDGASWYDLKAPDAEVVTDATTARTAVPATSGTYVRFTNAGTKTFTFDGAETYVVGMEYYARNVGAGDLTLDTDNGFTLNAPAEGSLVVPQHGTVAIKIVAVDEADVIGYTAEP